MGVRDNSTVTLNQAIIQKNTGTGIECTDFNAVRILNSQVTGGTTGVIVSSADTTCHSCLSIDSIVIQDTSDVGIKLNVRMAQVDCNKQVNITDSLVTQNRFVNHPLRTLANS